MPLFSRFKRIKYFCRRGDGYKEGENGNAPFSP